MTTTTTAASLRTTAQSLPILPPQDCLRCEHLGAPSCDIGDDCRGWFPNQEYLDAMNARQPYLEAAFSAVQNPADWKAPIDYILRATKDEPLVRMICEAIEHFTATVATVTPVSGDDHLLRIQAKGYRLGPAH